MTDDLDRIRRRHPDIPQDPLPFDVPDQPAKSKQKKQKSPKSIRFAKCPKCLADKPIGVIRGPGRTEIFCDHTKAIGRGRPMPCPGSGTTAPEEPHVR